MKKRINEIYKYRSIITCLIAGIFATLMMYTMNNIFIIVFTILVVYGVLSDKIEHKVEYLLFFVPWVYVIKFQQSEFSLFVLLSLIYIISCFVYIVIHKIKFNKKSLFAYYVFAMYVIVIPLLQKVSITIILGFLLNYTTIYLAIIFVKHRSNLKTYILMNSIGLLTSCVIRYIGYNIENINQFFIKINNQYTFLTGGNIHNRFSGMDQDPNYFAIQILITVSALIVCIYYEQNSKKGLILLCISLMVFGILSFSKMYIISLAILLLLSIFAFMKRSGKFAFRYIVLLLFVTYIIYYFFYDSLYALLLFRFGGESANIGDVTSGRSYSWFLYIKTIVSDIRLLLIGQGYGNSFLNSIRAHNIFLTSWYYMGLIGLFIMGALVSNMYSILCKVCTYRKERLDLLITSLPLFICLISNFALDSIIMDFFPYHILLIISCLCYKNRLPKTEGV